jgi:rubrerythrin
MGKSIKGTQTEKNLMAAFAGESMARNRYDYFSNAARSGPDKEGYEQMVNIFAETANNEKIHARMFLRYLEGGDVQITTTYPAVLIKDTKTNLEASADGEKMEWSTTYINFAKTARDEGFPDVANTFEQIAKAEKFHEARFRKLLDNLNKGEVFKKNTPVMWHCSNCGYVMEGTEAPKMCPACRHPMYYYELIPDNY